jgi:hypothetical protein
LKTRFLTYGSNGFEDNALLLSESAERSGFDAVECLGVNSIDGTEFARHNSAILSLKRGGGYWVWKAHLIRERVKQLDHGEVLLYSDAGRSGYYQLTRFPKRLLEQTASSEQGFLTGVAIPHLNLTAQWTKRDCLKIMGADTPEMYEKPLVQTTWSIWTKTQPALDFLDAWLHYSEDARCITDAPNTLGDENLPGFIDHRHDQSISSILTHQRDAPYLDFTGTMVQRLLHLRPTSELGQTFYKRVQNADDLLGRATPAILLREYLRLRIFR